MINTTSQIAPGDRTYYNRILLERATPFLAHRMFGQEKPVPVKSGDQPKFRRIGSLTAATTELTEGVTPAGVQASVTDVTATLKQYGNYLKISDKVQLVGQDPILTEFAELLGENAGESLDEIIRDILLSGTSVFYAGGVADRAHVNTNVSTTDLKKVIRALQLANAKPYASSLIAPTDKVGTQAVAPSYFGIVNPYIGYDLTGLTGWQDVQDYPSQVGVLPGEIGAYRNIRFVQTTKGKTYSSAGASSKDVHIALIFGQNAYGVTELQGHGLENIVKALGTGGTEDPLDQRATSAWKSMMSALILNEAFMYRYECTATA